MRSDLKSATRGGSLIEEGGLAKSPKPYKRGVSSNTDRSIIYKPPKITECYLVFWVYVDGNLDYVLAKHK